MLDSDDYDKIADPVERVRRVNELIDQHQAAVSELSRVRRELLEGLLASGWTQVKLAAALDMSRSRISQLLSAGVRPERALLGTGPKLLVAIGGRYETGRRDNKPLAVVSEQALAAYDQLSSLARSLGLATEYEVVPPPGMVQLNRDNLIVLTSPRLVPFVSLVLDADPHLGFSVDDLGWYLVDKTTGTEYRSPMEAGEPTDYAYIGRLPRPDGKGSFLYLAGIHGPGTAGAAHYIERNLADLYREVKGRRWSVLISCNFDPKTKQITSATPLTPIYRHEG